MKTSTSMLELFEAAQTMRCHTLLVNRPHNLAEHSFGVAMLCDFLSQGECSANLLRAALHHDLHEVITGDVPHPAKRANPTLRFELKMLEDDFNAKHGLTAECILTEKEAKLLHIADMLEFLMFCLSEWRGGNLRMSRATNTALNALEALNPNPRAMLLIVAIKEEMQL